MLAICRNAMKMPHSGQQGPRLPRRLGAARAGAPHGRVGSPAGRPGARAAERGATLVEFAMVLAFLFLLMLSIADFGLCFFMQHTLQFATREGVRIALVGRTLTDGDGNPMTREATIIKTIRDKASIAIPASRLRISIYPVGADLGDPNEWEGAEDAGTGGSYMRVRTSCDYRFITPLLRGMLDGGKLTLQAQSTYRNEQF
jgi:hypothetical protein